MTSNAGGRNDRPTLPPPFGASRQGAPGTQPPPKSNPSMPLAQPRPSGTTQPPRPHSISQPPPLGPPPPSQPFAPLGAPKSGTLTAVTPPVGPGTMTDVNPAAPDDVPMGHITAVSPPPIGAPPPSQPFAAAGPAAPSHSTSQAVPLGAPPAAQAFPPLGPPPASQPFGAAGVRPHSPSQPPPSQPFGTAGRGHATTQPPPSASTSQVVPLGPGAPAQPFPPLGPPPPSQPFAPAAARPHSPSQPLSPVSGRSHSATQPPPSHGSSQVMPLGGPLGPPPPSQPFAPAAARPHSPSQPLSPVSGRSHSATQPPPSHGSSQAVPLGPTGSSPSNPIPLMTPSGGLGPPPPSGPISPVGGRSHSATQPPPTRTHATTQPPPLGAPPPSQPFGAAPRLGTPAQSMPPITTDQTHLGIPSAPQGKAGPWAPQPAQPTVELGPPGQAPGAGDELVAMSAPIVPSGAYPSGPAQAGLVALVRRAFRLRVEPADVQPDEAKALEVAGIHDPHHRAFLAWRRSVLLVSAVLFAPLALFRLIEVLRMGAMPGALQALQLLPSLAEGAFCALLWMQLRNWTRWQAQRRLLLLGWAGAFLVPFVVFLYPVDGAVPAPSGSGSGDFAFLLNSAYALQALLVVGPKVLSLMPGVMRASLVTKLLFSGSPAPGWLVVLSAPVAALLIFLVFLVPYQITGSGYFILALAGLIGAQLVLGRAALRLARPSTQLDALSLIARIRPSYLGALGFGALFAIIALSRLSAAVHLGGLSVLVALLSFGSSALMLSLVGADLVVSNMEGARSISVDAQAAVAETQQRLTTFVRESTPGTNVMR